MCRFGWHRAEEFVEVTVAGADGAEINDRGTVILSHGSYGNRIFMDVHTNEEGARLRHG
jgi:hypothetical protein